MTSRPMWEQENRELRGENTRLHQKLEGTLLLNDQLYERLDAKNKRIEELEKFQQSLHPTELRDYMLTYYVFISDQTDAAWKLRIHPPLADPPPVYIPASKLGIVRCDGCGGSGTP